MNERSMSGLRALCLLLLIPLLVSSCAGKGRRVFVEVEHLANIRGIDTSPGTAVVPGGSYAYYRIRRISNDESEAEHVVLDLERISARGSSGGGVLFGGVGGALTTAPEEIPVAAGEVLEPGYRILVAAEGLPAGSAEVALDYPAVGDEAVYWIGLTVRPVVLPSEPTGLFPTIDEIEDLTP